MEEINKTETWANIPNFSRYQVSNLGRVRSFARKRYGEGGLILSPHDNGRGYLIVAMLDDSGKPCSPKVHRLVATAFIPNPDNLPQVNHKDENRANNCLDNLEWCTNEYNCNYGNHGKNLSEILKTQVQRRRPVAQYSLDDDFIMAYSSLKEADECTGISFKSIQLVCKGKAKLSRDGSIVNVTQTHGFKFKYITQEQYEEYKLSGKTPSKE